MKKPSFPKLRMLLIAICISVCFTPSALLSQVANAPDDLTEIGFVPSSNDVVVREEYSTIHTRHGYQKAGKVSSIRQSVGFQALSSKTVVNKDVCLQIRTIGDIESKSVGCDNSTAG